MSEVASSIKNYFKGAGANSASANSSGGVASKPSVATLFSFVLCILCCTSICQTIECGFYVSDSLRENFVINFLVCLCVQFVLHIEVFSNRKRIYSRALFAILSLICIFASVAFATTLNPVQDVPENYFVSVCIFIAVNAIVFALLKRKSMRYVLLIVGCFICAYIQLLYEFNKTASLILFLIAALFLIANSNRDGQGTTRNATDEAFKNSYKNANSQKENGEHSQLGSIFMNACIIFYAMCICALGALIAFGIIQCFQPGALIVELTTEYMAYPEDLVRSAVSSTENPDIKDESNNVDENNSKTTTDKETDSNSNVQDGSSAQGEQNNSDDDTQNREDAASGATQGVSTLALNTQFPWYLLLLLVLVVALFVLYALPYFIRRHRLSKIQKLDSSAQIEALYYFFISRFRKLGIVRGDTVSEIDFANLARVRIEPYAGSQAPGTFDHLSALFIEQKYGGVCASTEDVEAMHYLYWKFYENVRAHAGWFKFRIRYIAL